MNYKFIERHEVILNQLLDETAIASPQLQEAIHYSLFPGGKRLRPLLVYLTGEIIQAPIEALDYIAAAIELTHCYSLIHDDLPAMDNDDYRRGKLSCHKAFDEATAILAGDALQALAIDVLINYLIVSAEKKLAIIKALIEASGPSGMVSGQSLDLIELAKPALTEEKLLHIHFLKTGKLIEACITMTLATTEVDDTVSQSLTQFAHHFGILFQMRDDYLDAYASSDLGKKRSSDQANSKFTFVNLYSKEKLEERFAREYQLAMQCLSTCSNASGLMALLENLKLAS